MSTIFAYNKRANYDYTIIDKLEAGIVLTGQEVKSIKSGHCQLNGSYATIKKITKPNNKACAEVYLLNSNIPLYKYASKLHNYDPTHSRKLLLKKKEIEYLQQILKSKHLTLVPLKVYNKRALIKVELGIGKGKKEIDKRAAIKKREINKTIRQAYMSK